jgi:lipoprotein-anchoring transpeptidase ErfK/SrfK
VQYAENEKFSKGKKTKTIDSAKTTKYSISRAHSQRDYYVRVLAYVETGGKTYNSDYTEAKSKEASDASWYKKLSKKIGKNTKWIETDLSSQIVYLHKGEKTVKSFVASTGKPSTPTIKGTFKLTKKIKKHDMIGIDPKTGKEIYRTPNVPWSSFFKEGYAFHGASWNSELKKPLDEKRVPKSHGCVNMRVKDAKYLYDWAPVGTIVVVHK